MAAPVVASAETKSSCWSSAEGWVPLLHRCIPAQLRVSRHPLEAGLLPWAQLEAQRVGISSSWPTAGKRGLGAGAPAPLPRSLGFVLYGVAGNLLSIWCPSPIESHSTLYWKHWEHFKTIFRDRNCLAGGLHFAHLVPSSNFCHRICTLSYWFVRVVLRGNTPRPSSK